MSKENSIPTQNVSVRYEKSEVIYATQFLASPSGEELLLDFSSGMIAESADGNSKSLPIHSRLAMPWSAVERLTKILNQVVDKRRQLLAQQQTHRPDAAAPAPTIPQASIPSMSTKTT